MDRIIDTGIEVNQKNKNIMDSIVGQMSDGIWEESRYMEKYWKSINFDYSGDTTKIKIVGSGFVGKSDAEVLDFLAGKIYTITRINLEDQREKDLRKEEYEKAGVYEYARRAVIEKEDNETDEEFRNRCSDIIKKEKEAESKVDEFIKENPVNFQTIFNDKNTDFVPYLDYPEYVEKEGFDYKVPEYTVTVADAYNVYETLKNKVKELNSEHDLGEEEEDREI